ncbi:unnamed protein product, partial [Effrenium voratum]
VLEVGAGSLAAGSLQACKMMSPGSSLTLSDVSPAMVEAARRNLAAAEVAPVKVQVTQLNAVDLASIASDSQDVYLANLCLHHTSDMGCALAEALRVLRPGGRLGVAEVDTEEPGPLFDMMEQARTEAGIDLGGHGHSHGHGHGHGHACAHDGHDGGHAAHAGHACAHESAHDSGAHGAHGDAHGHQDRNPFKLGSREA